MWVHAMDQYADIFEGVKPRMDTVEVFDPERGTLRWTGISYRLSHEGEGMAVLR